MFFIAASSSNPEAGKEATWADNFHTKFTTGAEASAWCRVQNEYNARYSLSTRYRVRKVLDTDNDNFIAREAAKNHAPIPWECSSDYMQRDYNDYMLPHIDPDNPRHIRFFRSVSDAVECKYTTMSMSRFISQHEDYDEDERIAILIKGGYYEGTTECGIATEAEQIIDIYQNGPTSCMNDEDEYPLPDPHPSIVYSKGDLAVAFVKNGEDYTARAVVHKEKKIFCNIYGHYQVLEQYLKDNGYEYKSNSREWKGSRVGKFEDGDGNTLMPYIDTAEYGHESECGEYIIIGCDEDTEGAECIRMTSGYMGEV